LDLPACPGGEDRGGARRNDDRALPVGARAGGAFRPHRFCRRLVRSLSAIAARRGGRDQSRHPGGRRADGARCQGQGDAPGSIAMTVTAPRTEIATFLRVALVAFLLVFTGVLAQAPLGVLETAVIAGIGK